MDWRSTTNRMQRRIMKPRGYRDGDEVVSGKDSVAESLKRRRVLTSIKTDFINE